MSYTTVKVPERLGHRPVLYSRVTKSWCTVETRDCILRLVKLLYAAPAVHVAVPTMAL